MTREPLKRFKSISFIICAKVPESYQCVLIHSCFKLERFFVFFCRRKISLCSGAAFSLRFFARTGPTFLASVTARPPKWATRQAKAKSRTGWRARKAKMLIFSKGEHQKAGFAIPNNVK